MSYLIGVDPGVSGAIVILQSAACPFPVDWLRMPIIKQGKSSRVDAAAVSRFLQDFDVGHAYIEQVGSMPGQGVASTFTFGHAAGVVEGVVVGQMIPITKVTTPKTMPVTASQPSPPPCSVKSSSFGITILITSFQGFPKHFIDGFFALFYVIRNCLIVVVVFWWYFHNHFLCHYIIF